MKPFSPFSKRFKKGLVDKKIRPSFSTRVRTRLWYLLEEYNWSWLHQPDSNDSWTTQTNAISEVAHKLKMTYGAKNLEALVGNKRAPVDISGFVVGCYPSQLLDVLELYQRELEPDKQPRFQELVNLVFCEEGCPWLLHEGSVFQLDSIYVEAQLLSRAHELLKENGYEGALQEFLEARNDLDAGDYKGAVHNSCKSFESALKAVLGGGKGNASALITELGRGQFYSNLPEEVSNGFGSQILMSLPFLRNKLGGHGQGMAVIEAPRSMAELSVHLAAVLINFVIRRHLELSPRETEVQPENDGSDEVPF